MRYHMESRANYFIVGLFIIGLTTILAITIFWLSSKDQAVYKQYLVYIGESVDGLNIQAPVKFNGVQVGSVVNIEIDPHNPQQVRLLLNIQENTPINQSTKATLRAQGITGMMFVGLTAGAAQAPLLKIATGEKYPVIVSQPSMLMQLDTAIRELTMNVSELLNDDNQKAIHHTLQNLDKISGVFANKATSMSATLQDSQQLVQNMSQQMMPSMLDTFNRFNRVLTDVGPLTRTLQDNPSALIRGKKNSQLGPGER